MTLKAVNTIQTTKSWYWNPENAQFYSFLDSHSFTYPQFGHQSNLKSEENKYEEEQL